MVVQLNTFPFQAHLELQVALQCAQKEQFVEETFMEDRDHFFLEGINMPRTKEAAFESKDHFFLEGISKPKTKDVPLPTFAMLGDSLKLPLCSPYSAAAASQRQRPSQFRLGSVRGCKQELPVKPPQLPKTTLVLRKLPPRCSQNRILREFFVPNGSFDFLFVPYSAQQRRPARYCFVNFTSSAAAQAFADHWHGRYLMHPEVGEPLDVRFAEVQGLVANVLQHRHLAYSARDFFPAVFQGTRRVGFRELVALLDGQQ